MENYYVNEQVDVKGCGRRRRRVSWGAIFAGTVVVLAVSMLLSILGSAIGMFIMDPTSSEPFSGVFGTVSIWTGISILIGLACGGFVAGKLAGADGFIHGFAVWSLTMLAGVLLVGSITAGLVKLTGNILGAAGNVVAQAGSAVGGGISAMADEAQNIFGEIYLDSEGGQLRDDVRRALKRSGVRELQPEYIQRQFREVNRDLRKTVNRVITNPQQAGDLITGFTDRLGNRIDKFTGNINKEDVVSLVANNSNLSRAEAEDTVDQYIELIDEGRDQLDQLQQEIQQAADEWDMRKEQLLEEARKASNRAGWAGVIAFIILLIGAAVTSFAGGWGAKKTMEGYEA